MSIVAINVMAATVSHSIKISFRRFRYCCVRPEFAVELDVTLHAFLLPIMNISSMSMVLRWVINHAHATHNASN